MLATTSLKLEISLVIFQNDVWGCSRSTTPNFSGNRRSTGVVPKLFPISRLLRGPGTSRVWEKTKRSPIIPQKLAYLLSPQKTKETNAPWEKKNMLMKLESFCNGFHVQVPTVTLLHPQSFNTSPLKKRMLQKNGPFFSGFRIFFRGKLAVKLPGGGKVSCPTSWYPSENMLVKLGIFLNFRGENLKCLSCHHPANYTPPFKPLSNRNDLQDIDEACNAIGLRHVQDQFLEDFFADVGVDKAGQNIDLPWDSNHH